MVDQTNCAQRKLCEQFALFCKAAISQSSPQWFKMADKVIASPSTINRQFFLPKFQTLGKSRFTPMDFQYNKNNFHRLFIISLKNFFLTFQWFPLGCLDLRMPQIHNRSEFLIHSFRSAIENIADCKRFKLISSMGYKK